MVVCFVDEKIRDIYSKHDLIINLKDLPLFCICKSHCKQAHTHCLFDIIFHESEKAFLYFFNKRLLRNENKREVAEYAA